MIAGTIFNNGSVVTNLIPKLQIERIESGYQLKFNTQPGHQYTLQYKTMLDQPTWTDLRTVEGTGELVMIVDVSPAEPARFYRVTAQ
jgi:hypothetical protein